MPLLQEEVSLDQDERIIGFFRPHVFFVVVWSVPLTLALVLVFLFMFKFLSLGAIGAVIFILLCALLLFMLASRIVAWYGTLSILTERRLISIRRQSLFRKQVTEVALGNISELSYTSKGIIQTIFRFGNIHLTMFITNTKFTLYNIPSPQKVMDIISSPASKQKKPLPL